MAERLVDRDVQRDSGLALRASKALAERYATDAEYCASLIVTKYHDLQKREVDVNVEPQVRNVLAQ
jgi:hypothetical protein